MPQKEMVVHAFRVWICAWYGLLESMLTIVTLGFRPSNYAMHCTAKMITIGLKRKDG